MTQEQVLELRKELAQLAGGYNLDPEKAILGLCTLRVAQAVMERLAEVACQGEGGAPTPNVNGAAPPMPQSKSASGDIVPCAHRRVVMKTYYPYDPKDKRDHLHDFQCRDCGAEIPHESRRFVIAGERAEVGQ